MAKEYSRTRRIADQIQKDLATIIQQEIKDPRVGMVTINEVKVTKDLGYAEIYFTNMSLDDDAESSKISVEVLNGAAGFLRTLLAASLSLRVIPQLRFHYDSILGEASKMSELINKAVQSGSNSSGEES